MTLPVPFVTKKSKSIPVCVKLAVCLLMFLMESVMLTGSPTLYTVFSTETVSSKLPLADVACKGVDGGVDFGVCVGTVEGGFVAVGF